MGLISLEPKWEEEARFGQQAREWRALYSALCSSVTDGPREILNGAPQLAPFQPHPKDPGSLVEEFFPTRLEGTNFWDLKIRWSTDVQVTANPLSMPAAITIESQIREVPAVLDVNGIPVMNTAGDFFTDPPATVKLVDQVINITKNIGLILPEWTQTFNGSVNSDAVQIRGRPYDAGTLFCAGVGVGIENNLPGQADTISTIRSVPYTEAGIQLWFREDGWTQLYPNRGYFQLIPVKKSKFDPEALNPDGSPMNNAQIRKQLRMRAKFPKYAYYRAPCLIGPLGDKPAEPVFLDINGQMIQNPTPDNVIILEFDMNKKRPFSQFPLK